MTGWVVAVTKQLIDEDGPNGQATFAPDSQWEDAYATEPDEQVANDILVLRTFLLERSLIP